MNLEQRPSFVKAENELPLVGCLGRELYSICCSRAKAQWLAALVQESPRKSKEVQGRGEGKVKGVDLAYSIHDDLYGPWTQENKNYRVSTQRLL